MVSAARAVVSQLAAQPTRIDLRAHTFPNETSGGQAHNPPPPPPQRVGNCSPFSKFPPPLPPTKILYYICMQNPGWGLNIGDLPKHFRYYYVKGLQATAGLAICHLQPLEVIECMSMLVLSLVLVLGARALQGT